MPQTEYSGAGTGNCPFSLTGNKCNDIPQLLMYNLLNTCPVTTITGLLQCIGRGVHRCGVSRK